MIPSSPATVSLASLLLAASAYFTPVATAQQSENRFFELEEVTVTATRRETTLHDTAIAVTAFSNDMLETLNIRGPFDYEALVPSLTYQQTPNRVSIRGVGRFSNALGVNPGVAIYNDGIYQAEATSMASAPMNTERTEILRGPQGTLYGRNTTGGAFNVITRKPTRELTLELRARAGNYGQQEVAGLVSGPLTDNFRAKFYAQDTQRDGLQENQVGEDVRNQDYQFYDASFEWDISEKANLWVKYSTLEQDQIPGTDASIDPYDCVNFWEGLGRSPQYLECRQGKTNASTGDPRTVRHNTRQRQTLDNNDSVTVRLNYDFDSVQFSYLYGYLNYEYRSITDYDETDNEYELILQVDQNQTQATHEIQLASSWDKSWNFVFGLFYFEDENAQPYNIHTPAWPTYNSVANQTFTQFWDNPLGIIYFQNGELDNESTAAFGEVDIDFTGQWNLTLGARYSEDEYRGGETQLRYYDPYREFGFTPAPFAVDVSVDQYAGDPTRYVDGIDAVHKDNFNNWTGKVNLNYRPRDGHLLWGTIANGYKMGGVRLGSLESEFLAGSGVVSSGQFDQEDMVMYELGWKADLIDDKLRTELIGFYYVYDDMQRLRNFRTAPPASITLDEVVNMDAEVYGLEFSANWLLTDRLRAMGTYSYNHSEITSDTYFTDFTYGERDENNEIIAENVKGSQLQLTPEHKAALTLHYFWPTDLGQFTAGGTYAYVGKRYFNVGNHDSEDAYTRLDLQFTWTSGSGRYQVRGVVSNATDEEAYNTYTCSAASNGVYGTPSFITRCSGNPMDQRLYSAEFTFKL